MARRDWFVTLVDSSGNELSVGGGTQYADGTAAATPTGTVAMWNEGGTVRATSLTKPLPIGGPQAAGAALTANPVQIGFAGTGGTIRNWTAANSVTNTAGNDVPGVGPLVYDTSGALWNRMRDANSAAAGTGTGLAGAGNLVFDTTNWQKQAGDTSGNTKVVGTIAHDGVDSGAPVKEGRKAIAHGANPTAVSAADRTDLYANVAGIPFTIGGHPNVITRRDNFTSAQTDTALVTVSAGTIIVVTAQTFACDKANSVNVSATSGFGTASTPTGAGVVMTHPGIDPGGGMTIGNGGGMIGVGADNEDLRFTCSVPTGGSISITTKYYTIPV